MNKTQKSDAGVWKKLNEDIAVMILLLDEISFKSQANARCPDTHGSQVEAILLLVPSRRGCLITLE